MQFRRWTLTSGQVPQRWRFQNRRPLNHPRVAYRTRVLGTRSLRAFFFDGIFSAASDVMPAQFLAIYAIALGASDADIGILAAAAGLAGLVALAPGARIAERARSRKWVVLLSGGGSGRVMLLLMAFVPWFAEGRTAVYLLILLASLRWFAGMLGHPAWVSLTAAIVPLDLRRFYISRRMLGIAAVGAVGAPLIGRVIGAVGGLQGYHVALFISVGFAIVSTVLFARIEEPPATETSDRSGGSTREMLADSNFIRFVSGILALHITTHIAVPFFAPYMVRTLGASPTEIGILATISAIGGVGGLIVAGPLAERIGSERMLRWSLFVIPTLPIMWVFASEPWHAAIPNLIGGVVWAGFHLAEFNLLLQYAPERNMPRYAAAHQATLLFATLVGPLIGTVIVAEWGIPAALLASGFGRFLALGLVSLPRRAPVPAPPA
ncbi:MAG: MFS transporter [Chloroflexi bacterium]|nr:MFS transporter [Chloroflexota bacterium]MDA1147679.1 MFS transporter [Chloroflexota bacterium]